MIEIENLRLAIKEKEILKGIILHLQPGDTYGLLRSNGAGGSATIFAILGLHAYPRSGGLDQPGGNRTMAFNKSRQRFRRG